jgi:hypothetical protein
VTYQDVDGDSVTVKFTKPLLTAANVNSVFTFDAGNVNGDNGAKQQLRRIDLTVLGTASNGTGISAIAQRSLVFGGNGLANVGQILATGRDLAAVLVDGDLGQIDCGDLTYTTPGLTSLTVQSMGRFGTSTQIPGGDLKSTINGAIGSINVKSDLVAAQISVQGASDGRIGNLLIGGSLIGGAGSGSGQVITAGNIGTATIKGSTIGGTGVGSGCLSANGRIALLTVGGSLIGGTGSDSGRLGASDGLGTVRIIGDIKGGSGLRSGHISSQSGGIASIVVGGSLTGFSGNESGRITCTDDLGTVWIKGNVIGGNGPHSGSIQSNGKFAALTIGGSLRGGGADNSGTVFAQYNLGPVRIAGDIVGGPSAEMSGAVTTGGKLASITVGGSLLAGIGDRTGYISSSGNLGPVTIGGSIVGDGVGNRSATIECFSNIASITVGGSISTGSNDNGGKILAKGSIGSILVRGSLVGTDVAPVVIAARGYTNLPGTSEVVIKSLTVNGSVEHANILGGYDDTWAKNADAQIGAVVVGGDWIASNLLAGTASGADLKFGTLDDVLINDPLNDPAVTASIASILIKGQVFGTPQASDSFGFVAQRIGSMAVGGSPISLKTASKDFISLGPNFDVRLKEV